MSYVHIAQKIGSNVMGERLFQWERMKWSDNCLFVGPKANGNLGHHLASFLNILQTVHRRWAVMIYSQWAPNPEIPEAKLLYEYSGLAPAFLLSIGGPPPVGFL